MAASEYEEYFVGLLDNLRRFLIRFSQGNGEDFEEIEREYELVANIVLRRGAPTAENDHLLYSHSPYLVEILLNFLVIPRDDSWTAKHSRIQLGAVGLLKQVVRVCSSDPERRKLCVQLLSRQQGLVHLCHILEHSTQLSMKLEVASVLFLFMHNNDMAKLAFVLEETLPLIVRMYDTSQSPDLQKLLLGILRDFCDSHQLDLVKGNIFEVLQVTLADQSRSSYCKCLSCEMLSKLLSSNSIHLRMVNVPALAEVLVRCLLPGTVSKPSSDDRRSTLRPGTDSGVVRTLPRTDRVLRDDMASQIRVGPMFVSSTTRNASPPPPRRRDWTAAIRATESSSALVQSVCKLLETLFSLGSGTTERNFIFNFYKVDGWKGLMAHLAAAVEEDKGSSHQAKRELLRLAESSGPCLGLVLRTLRVLLQNIHYRLCFEYDLVMHSPSFSLLLKSVLKSDSKRKSKNDSAVDSTLFKVELATTFGLIFSKNPFCRYHVSNEMHAFPIWSLSIKNQLLRYLSLAEMEYFAGVRIVDALGVDLVDVVVADAEFKSVGGRCTKGILRRVFQAQEERFMNGPTENEDVSDDEDSDDDEAFVRKVLRAKDVKVSYSSVLQAAGAGRGREIPDAYSFVKKARATSVGREEDDQRPLLGKLVRGKIVFLLLSYSIFRGFGATKMSSTTDDGMPTFLGSSAEESTLRPTIRTSPSSPTANTRPTTAATTRILSPSKRLEEYEAEEARERLLRDLRIEKRRKKQREAAKERRVAAKRFRTRGMFLLKIFAKFYEHSYEMRKARQREDLRRRRARRRRVGRRQGDQDDERRFYNPTVWNEDDLRGARKDLFVFQIEFDSAQLSRAMKRLVAYRKRVGRSVLTCPGKQKRRRCFLQDIRTNVVPSIRQLFEELRKFSQGHGMDVLKDVWKKHLGLQRRGKSARPFGDDDGEDSELIITNETILDVLHVLTRVFPEAKDRRFLGDVDKASKGEPLLLTRPPTEELLHPELDDDYVEEEEEGERNDDEAGERVAASLKKKIRQFEADKAEIERAFQGIRSPPVDEDEMSDVPDIDVVDDDDVDDGRFRRTIMMDDS